MTRAWLYVQLGGLIACGALALTLSLSVAQWHMLGISAETSADVDLDGLEQRRTLALEQLASLPEVQKPAGASPNGGPLSDTQMLASVRDAALAARTELISSQVAPPIDGTSVRVMVRARGDESALLIFAGELERGALRFRFDSFEILPIVQSDGPARLELSGVLRSESANAL